MNCLKRIMRVFEELDKIRCIIETEGVKVNE